MLTLCKERESLWAAYNAALHATQELPSADTSKACSDAREDWEHDFKEHGCGPKVTADSTMKI